MREPPALPPVNAELRRLLAAGPPPDGNQVPFMRALRQAALVVPMHPQGGLLRMARASRRRPGEEEVVLHAFTSHELAARFASQVRDAPPERMTVMSSIELCKRAIADAVDAIHVDSGAPSYAMYFHGMMDLLSAIAFDGKNTIAFEAVSVRYGIPKTPMPASAIEPIRALGQKHGLTRLAWCTRWMGDAPGEMLFSFTPYPCEPFARAVAEHMSASSRGRYTFGSRDASQDDPAITPHLQVLI
ncbi:MAG: hypothetical protein U0234_24190 [Sandaracinus sp.]